jgi:hypothetical protein
MKSSDRSILIGLIILGIGAAFWFMVLAPKRQHAGELEDEVASLRSEVSAQEQLAAAAEQAQAGYERTYGKLVVLGKAAPEDGGAPSLLVDLTELADRAGVSFEAVTVSEKTELAPTAAAETTTDQNLDAGVTPQSSAAGATTTTPEPAPATEATASTLPTGAPVGSAGLEVQGYDLRFTGDFFAVADLLAGLDAQVGARNGRVKVSGRLLTIDGFTMEVDEDEGLAVELTASSYLLPDSQGLTAGATPAAPPATVPASTTTTTAATP